jgi:hypothetical protein
MAEENIDIVGSLNTEVVTNLVVKRKFQQRSKRQEHVRAADITFNRNRFCIHYILSNRKVRKVSR